jgi:hypothetical protein
MAKTISCKWLKSRKILVNPDGQVWPCCYFANTAYYTKKLQETNRDAEVPGGHRRQVTHPVLQEYSKRQDDMNIFTNKIDDVLDNEWYMKILPESWVDSDSTHPICIRFCGEEGDV